MANTVMSGSGKPARKPTAAKINPVAEAMQDKVAATSAKVDALAALMLSHKESIKRVRETYVEKCYVEETKKKFEDAKSVAVRRPKAIANAGDAILERMRTKAAQIDPIVGASVRLTPRLQALLNAFDTRPADVMTWGEDSLRPFREAADRQTRLSHALDDLQAADWAREATAMMTRKTSLLDRLVKGQRSWSEMLSNLPRVKAELCRIAADEETLYRGLQHSLELVSLDYVAMVVCSEFLEEPTYRQLADNRVRSLLSGRQMAEMLIQTAQQAEALALRLCQDIAQLIEVTIPAWRLANPQRG